MLGQVLLKRYRILRLLGEGGMSKVYLAQRLDQPGEVAVKVLHEHLATQQKIRDHFRREIFIMSRFQHPFAVTLIEADLDGRPPFLAMEYLRGQDLTQVLERNKRLTPDRAGRLLGQLCEVLQAAHEQGIIHSDLKPANVMVLYPDSPVEQVKLMDFGLARMASLLLIGQADLLNTRQPTASGTPEYISPEQIRGNEIDRRCDLYSVGVMLYEMLTGRLPFQSTDAETLLLAHRDARPPSFAQLGLGGLVPPAIEAVVMRCLAKYPEDRFASAEALASAYEQALGRKILRSTPPAAALPARPSGVVRKLSGEFPVIKTTADRNAITHQLTASMPESMALIKLKGFIHDLGGEMLDTQPGFIRVRLAPLKPAPAPRRAGFLGWFGGGKKDSGVMTALNRGATPIDMELTFSKAPTSTSELSISLALKSPTGVFTPEARDRCQQIIRDLKAYVGCR